MHILMDSLTVKRYLPWVVATALFMEQLDSAIVKAAVGFTASWFFRGMSLKMTMPVTGNLGGDLQRAGPARP